MNYQFCGSKGVAIFFGQNSAIPAIVSLTLDGAREKTSMRIGSTVRTKLGSRV